jgi:hypothetical protein
VTAGSGFLRVFTPVRTIQDLGEIRLGLAHGAYAHEVTFGLLEPTKHFLEGVLALVSNLVSGVLGRSGVDIGREARGRRMEGSALLTRCRLTATRLVFS